jgi:quercetin dioxygenase-like cupin family protein
MVQAYLAHKGEGLPRHMHDTLHVTLVLSGNLLVRFDDRTHTIGAWDQPAGLPANKPHELEALQDDTVFVNITPIERSTA